MSSKDAAQFDVSLAAQSPHWNYGCAARFGFTWDERVAMSELMIGPEHVAQNDDGRVISVDLRGQTLSLERLAHLRHFPFIERLDLSNSSATNEVIPLLLELSTLKCVYLIGSPVTLWGILTLQLRRWNLQIDGPTDPALATLGYTFLGFSLLVIVLVIHAIFVWP